MFQKKIVFRSALILVCLCLLISCSFGVVASADGYSKIDISDHVSGREFVGNDVIVTYDLPLRPYTDLYGFATGSNVPLLISSFDGNLYFTQSSIDQIGSVYEEVVFVSEDDFEALPDQTLEYTVFLGMSFAEVQQNLQYFSRDYEDLLPISWTLSSNGHLTFSYQYWNTDTVYFRYTPEGYLRINYEDYYHLSYDTSIGFYRELNVSSAEYQRINGNMFPLGKTNGATNMIDVRDIRSGYGFTLSFDLSFTIDHDSETDLDGNVATFDAVWLDKNQEEVDRSQFEIDLIPYRDHANLQYDIDFTVPEGAAYFYLRLNTGYFYVNTAYEFSWVFRNISMTTMLSSIEENSQTMGKVVYKLDQLDGKLDGVIDGLGDVKDVLQDTNDKLDDMQGSIDKLPDEFGDEMQGVIDKEEEKHHSAGQEFVDQILDILPDSSTEIMAALKSLPDAMAYTGTDAVLQIPAITVPAIGDLVPRYEIWEGAELDFGEYVEMLPAFLLSLVRSLFTIAIVLFCAYELKGLISYCLTLKDNGRGA